ncbi:MAG: radical SAM protein [Deltaproteobacteria bacterium]|nr:radical SAM protein [Deltaproteobacteria bacterium]
MTPADAGEPRPAGPPWLRTLVAAAERAGVAVVSASALNGVLTLTLRGTSSRPLEVEVKPLDPAGRYILRTARYGLCYRGSARLSPNQLGQLHDLVGVLRALEAGFPRVLEAKVGVDALAATTGASGPAGFSWCGIERLVSPTGEAVSTEVLLRLTSRCNQACPFCSAPPPHAEPTIEAVLAWLDAAVTQFPRMIATLTGGEPTLWPGLAEVVDRLLARPELLQVKIQTNAVGFADAAALPPWPPSRRLAFFVSFHGARPDVYDLCVGSSGQFDRAVAGIRNLLAAQHDVVLNLVVNRHNVDHLDEWVGAVPQLFGPRPPRIHFSITMCPDHRPAAPAVLVAYTELAPKLQAAARRASAIGVVCEPLLSSSHASIPACLVDASLRRRGGGNEAAGGAVPVQRDAEIGIEDTRKPWVKAKRCAQCSQTRWCLGLPRAYVLRFGLAEVEPIA